VGRRVEGERLRKGGGVRCGGERGKELRRGGCKIRREIEERDRIMERNKI